MKRPPVHNIPIHSKSKSCTARKRSTWSCPQNTTSMQIYMLVKVISLSLRLLPSLMVKKKCTKNKSEPLNIYHEISRSTLNLHKKSHKSLPVHHVRHENRVSRSFSKVKKKIHLEIKKKKKLNQQEFKISA